MNPSPQAKAYVLLGTLIASGCLADLAGRTRQSESVSAAHCRRPPEERRERVTLFCLWQQDDGPHQAAGGSPRPISHAVRDDVRDLLPRRSSASGSDDADRSDDRGRRAILDAYLGRWCPEEWARLESELDLEVCIRTWFGGPNGRNKKSTIPSWQAYKAWLQQKPR